jgi:ketosteroid isomerase-like protein
MGQAESRGVIELSEARRFVERWAAIWRAHDGERWPELLHEDGVLRNPLGQWTRSDLPAYMAALVSSIGDHRLEPLRWAATEDGVLIEWVMTGDAQGTPFEIYGVDRFSLRDGRVVEGVAYFDPRPLLAGDDGEAANKENG